MLWRLLAGLLILGSLAVANTARGAIEFSFFSEGVVFPTDPMSCPDPFAGCSMTVVGTAAATAGDVSPLPGPWNFGATFSIVAPLSPVTFLTTGVFGFDDPTAANDDFSGLLEGVLDVTTFTNTMHYTVTSSSGQFSGRHGFGSSLIQIIPQGPDEPFAFIEFGEFSIPEPGMLSLLGFGLASLGLFRRRVP